MTLLCTLSAYPNRKVAEAATTAFGRHLWYLSELLIGFSFFDDDVSIEEKRLMVMALIDTGGSDEPPKRISLFVSPETKRLHDFGHDMYTQRFFLDPRPYPKNSLRLIPVNENSIGIISKGPKSRHL